jgi:hypothetical protein
MKSYSKFDSQTLACSGTIAAFPTPNPAIVKNPEAIYVQSMVGNGFTIVIGKTGIAADGSAGGIALAAGAGMYLPFNLDEELKAIAGGVCKLLVTYLADEN